MPLQNRVRPDGAIVADATRGLFMGNRAGRLHDQGRHLGRRRWAGKAWICCLTTFDGRHRTVMGDGYTELFFLDEATALAAGHRPCFECRRAHATRFAELWNVARGQPGRAPAAEMDAVLHAERVDRAGTKRLHRMAMAEVADGAIVVVDGVMGLWWHGRHWPWRPEGYGPPAHVKASYCVTLTPPSIVAVLGAGYRPVLHGSVPGGQRA
jgi:hypothetical protein